MKYEEIVIEEDFASERIDKFLAEEYENLSRSYLQKLIATENVQVNGENVKANYKLAPGDILTINIPPSEEAQIVPEKIDLDIEYEDQDIIIINKKKGMVVHPAPGNYTGTLVNALMGHFKDLSGINGVLRPGIVHRIDKDTSGLILVCKNDNAHKFLAEQFKDHTVERGYYALVHGIVNEPLGRIEAPIGRNEKDRKKMAVTFKNSKEAITNYRVIERFPQGYTLIECTLETGRTHQIRVHMAYLKHPLVGDYTYGSKKKGSGFLGQVLHAYKLGFIHPTTKEKTYFESELPDDFKEVLTTLREGEKL